MPKPCQHEWAWTPRKLWAANVYRCRKCRACTAINDFNVSEWEDRKLIPVERRKPR